MRPKCLQVSFFCCCWIWSPHAFTLLSTLWMNHSVTTWQHTVLCAMSWETKHNIRHQKMSSWKARAKAVFFWRGDETWSGGTDVGHPVGSCESVALNEWWSNVFWPLSVPYLNLLVNTNVHCQSRKLLNRVSSCSVGSTHKTCWCFVFF